jgi:endonuclease YncB( thermonuclease family)
MKRLIPLAALTAALILAACGGSKGEASVATSEASTTTQASTTLAPTTTTVPAVFAAKVVDGDTLTINTGENIRIVGIDTPEVGQCGYVEASDRLTALLTGKTLTLTPGAQTDKDKYDRLLRYVDVDGTDVGLTLIQEGLAIARYDSRDGYGAHPREAAYVAADAASPSTCLPPAPVTTPAPVTAAPPPVTPATTEAPAATTPATQPKPSGSYKNCTEAKAAGAAPLHRGDPGYSSKLDGDGDGVACES